jgi:hypothetical protein
MTERKDDLEQRDEGLGHTSFRAAATVPVMIAVVVGVLYTLGALFKAAELQGAHVSVSEYLPLVPLPQILGTGIATMAPILPLLILLIVFGAVANEILERARLARKLARGQYRALLFALALFLLLLVFQPPIVGASAVIAVIVVLLARRQRRAPFTRTSALVAVAGGMLVIGVGFVLQYFVHPKPLSVVAITSPDGRTTRGRLILDTGSVYYIATSGRRSLAIDHSAAVRARLRSFRLHWRTTFDYLHP